jgi:hypothetical protein
MSTSTEEARLRQEHLILSRVESMSAAEVGDPAPVTSLAAAIS